MGRSTIGVTIATVRVPFSSYSTPTEAININREGIGTVVPITGPDVRPGLSLLVNVTFPNGSEVLRVGDQVPIQWETGSVDGSQVVVHTVKLFTDGSFNRDIATNLPGHAQSYLWTVPDIQTTRAIVMVQAINEVGRTGSDRSNNVFTIQGQAQGSTPVISSLQPTQILAGAISMLVVSGSNLSLNLSDYSVVNSLG